MTKVLKALLLLCTFHVNMNAQTQTLSLQENVDEVIMGDDTLYIASIKKEISSKFYSSSLQASFLVKQDKGTFDTLLFIKPDASSFETLDGFGDPDAYNFHHILQEEGEFDSTHWRYSAIISVEHLHKGIFEITNSTAEYTGGAHGYGTDTYEYYDYEQKRIIDFDDIFERGVWEEIYQQFLEEFGLESSQTNFEDKPQSFQLTENEIIFSCGMYGSLFGISGNYLGCELRVQYSSIQKYIRKDSAIHRLHQ